MAIRRILFPLDGMDAEPIAMNDAARLADDFKAHLDVVLRMPDPASFIPTVGLGEVADKLRAGLVKSIREKQEETENTIKEQFDALTQKENLTVVASPQGPGSATARYTSLASGEDDTTVIRFAQASDLTVVGASSSKQNSSFSALSERILMKSGRPVLFIPEAGTPAEINRVGVAWDGGDEAARSIAAAMPFLQLASDVDVVSIDNEPPLDSHPDDVAEYLAWHGISAETHMMKSEYQRIGEKLIEFSQERNWDFLIMGAYDSSRFVESIFSGPTQNIRRNANIPVLQMH